MQYLECKNPLCGNPIFSMGLCRKHYEQERLARAAPCSFCGCLQKAFRGTLCEAHYRKKLLASRPLCIVPACGCPQKNLTTQLCTRHEFRSRKHGSLEQPRAADWGAREAHPLYQTYHAARRSKKMDMIDAWRHSFWEFVKVVGERPAAHTFRRIDNTKPLGPDNWYWKTPLGKSADASAYARVWRRNNPDKAKNANLKKNYGITLDAYNAMHEGQQDMCAICGGKERSFSRDGAPVCMSVDHDHTTGKVRGLLCNHCNRGLGMFTDSIEKLKAAVAYLEKHAE